jgi:hypothetical protein
MREQLHSADEIEIKRLLESLGSALEDAIASESVSNPLVTTSKSGRFALIATVAAAAVIVIAAAWTAIAYTGSHGHSAEEVSTAALTAGSHAEESPGSTTSAATAAPSPQDLLSRILPLAGDQYGISFPSNAIAEAQKRRDNAYFQSVQSILKSRLGASWNGKSSEEQEVKMLSVGGKSKNGSGISFTVITYPVGKASIYSAARMYPGSSQVDSTADGSDCTLWKNDRSYPGGRSIQVSAVTCPTATLGVVTKSASSSSELLVTPSQAKSILTSALEQ